VVCSGFWLFEHRSLIVTVPDVVFLRAWYSVEPPEFYNPVTSLLVADKSSWSGMRRTGQIRRDEGINTPLDINSVYRPVDRIERRFNPLKIPRKLQEELPYASKPKMMKARSKSTYMQRRAVILEPEEKNAIALLQQVRALRNERLAKRREKRVYQAAIHRKQVENREVLKSHKLKEDRRMHMREASLKRKRDVDKEDGDVTKRQRN